MEKKILFVTGALSDGGAERVMSILASRMSEIGMDTSIIIMRNKKRIYPLSEKVKVFQIHEEGKRHVTLRRLIELRKILKENKHATVIPFLPIITLYTMIAGIGIPKRLITSERGDPRSNLFAKNFSTKDKIANLFIRKMKGLCLADWVVFQTPDAQSYYGKKVENKSCVIPNPLDTSYLPERYTGERRKVIIAAGRFSEEKNFELLINGFAQFAKNHPDYRLELYGEGGLRSRYQTLIEKLDILDKVEMPGFASDLLQRMNDAAMYISTSNHEGISNSMLEALGMGVPTIVTDCPVGGARMFVHTDENGILIPMNDLDALVIAMNKISETRDYAEKLSMNAINLRNDLQSGRICDRWLSVV